LQRVFTQSKVLFCFWHYYESLRNQFQKTEKQDAYIGKAKAILEQAPLEVDQKKFEKIMEDLQRRSGELCSHNEKMMAFVEKVHNERQLWGRCYHMHHFTGGVNVCLRNDNIKRVMSYYFRRKDISVDEICNAMVKTEVLQGKDYMFREYKRVVSQRLDQLYLIKEFGASYLSGYAIQRIRWNIFLGSKFKITQEDPGERFEVTSDDEKMQSFKLIVINSFLVCSCLERLNSGFPCPHELAVYLKKRIPFAIADRWYRHYEELMGEIESRNDRIDEFVDKNYNELQHCFDSLIAKDPSSIRITKEDIRLMLYPNGQTPTTTAKKQVFSDDIVGRKVLTSLRNIGEDEQEMEVEEEEGDLDLQVEDEEEIVYASDKEYGFKEGRKVQKFRGKRVPKERKPKPVKKAVSQ